MNEIKKKKLVYYFLPILLVIILSISLLSACKTKSQKERFAERLIEQEYKDSIITGYCISDFGIESEKNNVMFVEIYILVISEETNEFVMQIDEWMIYYIGSTVYERKLISSDIIFEELET